MGCIHSYLKPGTYPAADPVVDPTDPVVDPIPADPVIYPAPPVVQAVVAAAQAAGAGAPPFLAIPRTSLSLARGFNSQGVIHSKIRRELNSNVVGGLTLSVAKRRHLEREIYKEVHGKMNTKLRTAEGVATHLIGQMVAESYGRLKEREEYKQQQRRSGGGASPSARKSLRIQLERHHPNYCLQRNANLRKKVRGKQPKYTVTKDGFWSLNYY